jgi:hypothetical protein
MLTQVVISIQVDEGQILNSYDMQEWIRDVPILAETVQIHAVVKSYSTLVIMSIPVAVWNLLPDDPAVTFVGFATSGNLLLMEDDSQQRKVNYQTEVDVSYYEMIEPKADGQKKAIAVASYGIIGLEKYRKNFHVEQDLLLGRLDRQLYAIDQIQWMIRKVATNPYILLDATNRCFCRAMTYWKTQYMS